MTRDEYGFGVCRGKSRSGLGCPCLEEEGRALGGWVDYVSGVQGKVFALVVDLADFVRISV